jgi:16S rRNA (guanine966-N2)-methyltransferase
VRPTAEPVRAALLDMLGTELAGARILDLFAGTGALGLEAISRGARTADFVEFRPASLHALRANVAALRLRERTRIFKRDAMAFAQGLETGSYDIAFADPPYTAQLLDRLLEIWRVSRFSRLIAVEHTRDQQLPNGFRRKVFEETAVTIYR